MVRDGEMAIREMKRLDENIADPASPPTLCGWSR